VSDSPPSNPGLARRLIRRLGIGPTLRSLLATRLMDTTQLHALPERTHLSRLLSLLEVDCVFDIGANQGQYAEMLRRHVRYQGLILSFEPIPGLATLLRSKAKKDPNWRIEELALAGDQGRRQFHIMQSSSFSSLSTPRHEEVDIFQTVNVPVQEIWVQTDTLTGAYRRLKGELGFRRAFLKLDTQGLDVEIVRGGREIIGEFVGLQSELAMKRIYEDSVDFREAIGFYQSLGFEMSALVPNNAGHFPLLVEMDCIMVRSDLLHTRPPAAPTRLSGGVPPG
jgi:FkbM family methyltransferase